MAAYHEPTMTSPLSEQIARTLQQYQGQAARGWMPGGIHAGRRDDHTAWWLQESTNVDRQDPRAEH